MALDRNQKISLLLGIGVLVALLLGVFLLGVSANDDSYGSATSQNMVVYSPQAKSSSSDYLVSKSTKKSSSLGQTLKEQQYSNPPTVINNIDIDISVPTSYNYPRPYYHKGYYNYGYYKPYYNYHYNKYYNSYYPYNSHGFYYSNSYGSWHKYNSW